ncbi:hypothetical protein Dsin_008615 [Dipteronia sinensis]|uniref:peptidylprolyl isomerase n=1 Tax=Dipteronia sinensis TaxID=43782 RepID=A0AAE0ECN9_9ROSI|nr:hypothetical protein Dsin_008615 [Dipteronia sinensis]
MQMRSRDPPSAVRGHRRRTTANWQRGIAALDDDNDRSSSFGREVSGLVEDGDISDRSQGYQLRKERLAASQGSNRQMNPSAAGSTDKMDGFIVHCDRHWIDNQVMGPISFTCNEDKYSKLLETICHRIGVSSDRFQIRISSDLITEKGSCTLPIMSDTDVSCLLSHNQSSCTEIKVEVVERSVPPKGSENVFQILMKFKNTTIHSCIPSAFKPSSNSESLIGTPYFKSVSGSNQPYWPSPGFRSTEKDQRTPPSTNKHVETEVDDSDSSETSDIEDKDECSSYRQVSTDCREAETDRAPNSFTPSTTTWWTIPGDLWESFKILPVYFHMLEKSNLGMIRKIETYRKNQFKYGFMTLEACIEGFNTVIRPVIVIVATHLKSKTRGVLLVAVCKDVSDRHTCISNAMKAIFPDAAHGVYAYHLAKNLKQHCRKRGDVISLYYRATYVYIVEEFDPLMVEMNPSILSCLSHLLPNLSEICCNVGSKTIEAYATAVNPVPKPEAWDIANDVQLHMVVHSPRLFVMLTQERKANPRVFFDLNIDCHPAGRLVIELFTDNTPKTEEKFWALCIGEKGIGRNGKPLHYKGTIFHRVNLRSMFKGEDLTEGNRLRGESIYSDSFTDENFVNKHTGPGILFMANTGPNTNDSQFLICNAKTEWLDGSNVIFSQVIEGFDIIKVVKKVGSISSLTSKPVTVTNCGQLS